MKVHHQVILLLLFYSKLLIPLATATAAADTAAQSGLNQTTIKKSNKTNNNNHELNGTASAPAESDKRAAAAAAINSACGFALYRLPGRFVPRHYDLLILPDIGAGTFEGTVQISLSVAGKQAAAAANDEGAAASLLGPNQIVLHASENLQIDNVWYLDQTMNSSSSNNNNNKSFNLSSSSSSSLTGGKLDPTLLFNDSQQQPQPQSSSTGSYIEVLKICRDHKYQLLVLTLAQDLPANSAGRLHFTFTSYINKKPDLFGLYETSWLARQLNSSGANILTQFQPTHARQMFPCFDEPALKATFELSLIYPENLTALANTQPQLEQRLRLPPISGDNNSSSSTANVTTAALDFKWVRFERTPPMSTYLLAFTLGDYEFIEDFVQLRTKKLRVRAYTTPGKSAGARFALDTAIRAMRAFHGLLDDEYPLAKLDLVGVRDFGAGAMENWGLVTIREQYLLFDANNTGPAGQLEIASIIIHELAHQWFGNFVTMSWWNDIWLNEGFTTWIEYKILAQIYPQLAEHHYLFDAHLRALEADQIREARAIRLGQVERPAEIENLFDYVSYQKSAAVIRMLELSWPRWANFWKLIKHHIKANRFKSVDLDDLLASLAEDKSLPGALIATARSWIEQPGYPMIRLSLMPAAANGSRKLAYEQERFIAKLNDSLSSREAAQMWSVPAKVLLSNGKRIGTEFYHLNKKRGSIDLPSWWAQKNQSAGSWWIKFNQDFAGFYRVWYSDELFRALANPIRLQQLSVPDRVNLIDDTLAQFGAKRIDCSRLVWLIGQFKDEKHGQVMETLDRAYNNLLDAFDGAGHNSAGPQRVFEKIVQFGRIIFGQMFERFPSGVVDSERSSLANGGNASSSSCSSIGNSIGRSAVLETLVQIGHERAIVRALNLFDEQQQQQQQRRRRPAPPPLATVLREPVYLAVAKRGSHAQFVRLIDAFKRSDSLEERARLLTAMAQSDNRTRLDHVWRLLVDLADSEEQAGGDTIDDDDQAGQQLVDTLSSMVEHRVGRALVLDLLANNMSDLVDLSASSSSLGPLVESLAESCEPDELLRLTEIMGRLSASQLWTDSMSDWPDSVARARLAADWRASVRGHCSSELLEAELRPYLGAGSGGSSSSVGGAGTSNPSRL